MVHGKSQSNPNAPDNTGWTPIHYAALKGHLEIIIILMTSADANPNAQDIWGKTPTDLARQNGHSKIVEELKMFQN